MKRSLVSGLLLALVATGTLADDPALRERILRHFIGWYSFYPNTRISVRETDEVSIPGLVAYRVQRQTDSKRHQEANVALYDGERDEVFVGRVLNDAARAAAHRSFDPLVDGPDIEKHLSDAFGVPATVTVKSSRGALKEINVALRQLDRAWVNAPGFISEDGASILLGEFQSLKRARSGGPAAGNAARRRRHAVVLPRGHVDLGGSGSARDAGPRTLGLRSRAEDLSENPVTRRGRLALAAALLAAACGKPEPETRGERAQPAPTLPSVESADVSIRPRAERNASAPVFWIGLDGLDWELPDRLSAAGRMPNWTRLVSEGHRSKLEAAG